MVRLRNGFTLLRQGTVDSSAKLLRRAGDEFFQVTATHDNWPLAWYGIGLAERALARGKFPVLPVRFHPLGADHNQGAIQAFVFAMQKDPTFLPAVEGLADAVQATTRWGYTGKARDALRRTATNSAHSLLVRARLEREDDYRERAVELLQRALQLGGDSGVVYLELAREQFALNHDADAVASYWSGVRLSTSPAAVAMLRDQLGLIAAPGELAGFDTLSHAARAETVQRFWTIRDVDAGVKAGDRLREHYSRYELASSGFRPRQHGMTAVPLNAAGRMAAAFGYDPTPTTSGRFEPSGFNFHVQRLGPPISNLPKSAHGLDDGYYRSIGDDDRRWSQDWRLPYLTYGTDSLPGEFDMRGQALLRYGKPDNVGGNLWSYHRPEGDLTLLVNGRSPGTPCGVNVRYCAYEARGIRPEELTELERELRADRGTLLASDRMIRPFGKALTPVVDAYAMIDGGAGEGRILVALAVPARQLAPEPTATGFVYPLRIHLIAAPASGAYRVERDTTRYFHTDRLLGENEYLQAVELLPVPAADYHLRVVVQSVDGERGSVGGDDTVEVRSTTGGVALGDLVLGRDSSGLSWWSGTDRLKLNPSGRIGKHESLSLYYQLGGLRLGRAYKTSIEVYRAIAPTEKPLIALTYDEIADQPVMEIQRVLGLERLDSGVHTIRLTISDEQGKVLAQRHASVRVD